MHYEPILTMAQQATGPGSTQQLGRWALWMLVLIIILLLMVIGMLSAVLKRRRDRSQQRPRQDSLQLDAWIEAGRRMQPRGESDESLPQAPNQPSNQSSNQARVGGPIEIPADQFSGMRPIALVTGGARRVGRATCIALARAGCDIVCTYHSSDDEAHTLLRELRSLGAAASAHRVNLLDLDAVDLFASFIADSMPRLDILVHNASVYAATPLHDLATPEALQQMSINAVAPLLLTAKLAPLLVQSSLPGKGAIVAMVDIHAMGRPRNDFIAYSMSKAALVEMVYSAAKELAPHVRVNGVAPGVVAWPETGSDSESASQAGYLRRVPLERAGTPADAAEAVRWLALDAHYTTGQIVRVDGGRWIT
jgi:pteridine reductase